MANAMIIFFSAVMIGVWLYFNVADPKDSGLSNNKSEQTSIILRKLNAPLESFRIHHGRYPSNEEGLKALLENIAKDIKWKGPYVSNTQETQDAWAEPIQYSLEADGSYSLRSRGEDSALDTADDILLAPQKK
jgi:hypothetical protein